MKRGSKPRSTTPLETMDHVREVEEEHTAFLKYVGYADKVLLLEDVNIILVTTNEAVDQNDAVLDEAIKTLNPDVPTILLGHHRIWDDIRCSEKPLDQFKTYTCSELHPDFKKHVDYIFVGNSARIWFGTYNKTEQNNENVVFWGRSSRALNVITSA
jgi:hypothetical protein